MSRRRAILLVTIVIALAATFLVFANPAWVWLRVLVGIPFVLLLPGQAIMLFIDPDGRLGGFEWFTLCVALSIALTTLLGMGLAASTAGLTTSGIVAALTVVAFLALLAAQTQTSSVPDSRATQTRRNSVQRASSGALALLACTLVILLLTIPGLGAGTTGRVVQLWGLPDGAGGLRIGTKNINTTSQHYHLTIEQGGRLISEQQFDIPAGTQRIFEVKKTATWTKGSPVTAVLTAADPRVAPRSISVWTTE